MKRLAVALTCLLPVVLMFGCTLFPQVKFEVTGSSPIAWIVYQNADGVVSQNSVSLPWSYSFTGRKGDWVELSAGPGSGGDVTVTIYENGSILATGSTAPSSSAAMAYGVL